MTPAGLPPLGGHAVFLLFVQLAVLLAGARAGAEVAKRFGLPAVVGELVSGLMLGPTVLGHFTPGLFAALFPTDQGQFHLLEVFGSVGMVFLLLLTGIETDLRLLKNIGRAALIASAMGMVVPFLTGFGLGLFTPERYLAQPDQRILFSLFLATAMAISAMPVIAKILMDLDLTRRNIGIVILSAGVVDDTAGWLVLSLIAGVVSHGEVRLHSLLLTVALTAAFLVAVAVVLYPLVRWLMAVVARRFRTPDADLVLIVAVAFSCAAATEWIGVHAVFGAFVAGTLLRQVPHLRAETVQRLESFALSILAPVFFGIVGLKVDLWVIEGAGMLLVVLAVACIGKLVGATVGSMWGGLRFWEGLSIAVAMNARGAMGLVLAMIGLSLGILTDQMFSIIVVMAMATSLLAPIGLKLTMRKVRMTEDESRRIRAEQARGVIDPTRVRILVGVAGGPNATGAVILASGIAKRSVEPIVFLHVKAPEPWWNRLRTLVRKPAFDDVGAKLAELRGLVDTGTLPITRELAHRSVADAVVAEAARGFDFLVLGASRRGDSLGGPVLEDVVEAAPCHLVIVRCAEDQPRDRPFRRLFVPFDGGLFSRVAVEVATRYAEATGAAVTVALLVEKRPQAAGYASEEHALVDDERATPEQDLARISGIFAATEIRPQITRLAYEPASSAVCEEAARGDHDLVIIGAENRAIQHRLFFGYDNERLIADDKISVAVVIPDIARLTKDATTAAAYHRRLRRNDATPPDLGGPRDLPASS